jgi:heme-binding NEAT domain protein
LTKPFRKTMAMLIAFVLLLSAIHIGPASVAHAATNVADGEYPIAYRYVKNGTTTTSAANYFMLPNTGKLIVKSGKAKLEHEIKKTDYSTFAYFGSRIAGKDKAVIKEAVNTVPVVTGIEGYQAVTSRQASDSNNVIVQVDVEDIGKVQDILMHIDDKDNIFQLTPTYNYWYNVGLELDTSTLVIIPENGGGSSGGSGGDNVVVTLPIFNELLTVGRAVYNSTQEGTGDGFYPVGSRTALNDSIKVAENLVASAPGNTVLLKAAYDILNEAINKYKALRIVVNKDSLKQLITEAEELKVVALAQLLGKAEGSIAISDKEYDNNSISPDNGVSLASNITKASIVRDDLNASVKNVTDAFTALKAAIDRVKNQQYHASTTGIIVFDSISEIATRSVYSNEFKQTATILQQVVPYYQAYTNITLVNPAGQPSIKIANPNAAGSYAKTLSTVQVGTIVNNSSDAQNRTYQIYARHNSANDEAWEGFSWVNYTVNSVTKNVYISYNADQLAALNTSIAAAKQLHSAAVTGTATGQYPATAKTKLLQAIGLAEAIGNKLVAKRPQIAAAATALQTAVDAFKASAAHTIYFSVAHATNNAFSGVESYFVKPSVLTTDEDGSVYAFVTIKNSTTVPEFKIKQNGVFVETAVVSTDAAANTRVVKFKVDDLSALLDARIRAVVPAQNYDQTYDIRLNFNNVDNSALSQVITAASAANKAAVTGTQPGQYPAIAKTAIQSAIDAANAEASTLTGSQGQTATALLALQQALDKFKASVVVTNPGTGVLADGEYPISYNIYKKGTNSDSVMFDYVDKTSGKLIVAGDKRYVSFTLKQSAEITSFKIEKAGVLTETDIVSKDAVNNTRIIKFEVSDLTARVNGWVKIYWQVSPTFLYDNEYDVELGFSNLPTGSGSAGPNKTVLNSLIANAQALHDAAAEGSAGGQYPADAKSTLLAAINQANTTAGNATASQQQLDDALALLQAAFTKFKASIIVIDPGAGGIADGEYPISYNIYKKGTNDNSVMYDYVDRTSGKLTVVGGKKYVSFILKQSAEITSFKTEKAGILTETEIVSKDAANNTRLIKFEVNDLTAKLNGWVKIYWQVTPTFLYDNEYDVELGFSNLPTGAGPQPIDLTKPVKNGEYSFTFIATSQDGSGTPISNFVENGGTLKVQNGKKLAAFKLKSGVNVTKIKVLKADGSNFDVLPQYSLKQSGMVRVLANEDNSKQVEFETEDLTATYAIYLAGADGVERTFNLKFDKVIAVNVPDDTVTTPTTPTTPSDGGTSGGGTSGGGSSGGGTSSTQDGKYTINFTILKNGTDQPSVMQSYVRTPGILSIEGGKQYISFTLKQSKEITALKVEQDGNLSDVNVLSSDEKANTRVIQYEVKDLSSRSKGWVKIDWAEMNYFHTYDIEISYDKASMKAIDKDASGEYITQSAVELLKNGDYPIEFSILQYKNNLKSVMDGSFKHPGTLTVKDKTRFVTFTLTQSKKFTKFMVDKDGKLADAEVISSDEASDSRVVKFEVKNMTSPIHGWVELAIPVDPEQAKADDDGTAAFLAKGTVKAETVDFDILLDTEAFEKKSVTPEKVDPAAETPANSQSGQSALTDTQNHWAQAAIQRAVSLGIVNGYEDGTFRPDGEINRAEFTVMISRALKLDDKSAALSFADMATIPDWVTPYLTQTVGAGIVTSYEDQTFRADRKISRSEIAVMIGRALGLTADPQAVPSFADANQIPEWALSHVAAAAKEGIINGRDNNNFAPSASATRAEAVTLIMGMLDHLKK